MAWVGVFQTGQNCFVRLFTNCPDEAGDLRQLIVFSFSSTGNNIMVLFVSFSETNVKHV